VSRGSVLDMSRDVFVVSDYTVEHCPVVLCRRHKIHAQFGAWLSPLPAIQQRSEALVESRDIKCIAKHQELNCVEPGSPNYGPRVLITLLVVSRICTTRPRYVDSPKNIFENCRKYSNLPDKRSRSTEHTLALLLATRWRCTTVALTRPALNFSIRAHSPRIG
jgi:hypothetical protein